MMKTLSKWTVTLFGVGYLPKAPGTWASLVTLFVGGLIIWNLSPYFYLLILFGSICLSLVCIHLAKDNFSQIDASEIVIDEWIGQLAALWPLVLIYSPHDLPQGETVKIFTLIQEGWGVNWLMKPELFGIFILNLGILFLGFRLLDIWKPGPIGWVDRIKNPFGIILDDLLAGIISGFIFFLIMLLLLFGLD